MLSPYPIWNYCNRLNREGKLLPGKKETPTLAEYSKGFWDWEKSAYPAGRKNRRKLTRSYADKNQKVTDATLVPYFGGTRLDRLGSEEIEKWFDRMIQKGYRNATINGYYGTLKTMLVWAAKKKIIPRDPTVDIERLLKDRKDVKLITRAEFRALFSKDRGAVWNNNAPVCMANKLAALTGMRCSEVLGLRGEYVFSDHLFLCGQHDEYGYRETKTTFRLPPNWQGICKISLR